MQQKLTKTTARQLYKNIYTAKQNSNQNNSIHTLHNQISDISAYWKRQICRYNKSNSEY